MGDTTANVFGVIVAGRPIQANFVQAGDTEFVTEVADAGSINHVVVFLTGIMPFPEGTGGSVYIRWARGGGMEPNWHFIGFICNQKPSAIFRVGQLHKMDAAHEGVFASMAPAFASAAQGCAQIGISVEPLNIIAGKVPAAGTTPSIQSSFMEFAEKMLKNFVNHVESFVVRLPRPDFSSQTAEYIPASVVQYWFNNFSRRLEQNPDFWKDLS